MKPDTTIYRLTWGNIINMIYFLNPVSNSYRWTRWYYNNNSRQACDFHWGLLKILFLSQLQSLFDWHLKISIKSVVWLSSWHKADKRREVIKTLMHSSGHLQLLPCVHSNKLYEQQEVLIGIFSLGFVHQATYVCIRFLIRPACWTYSIRSQL